MAARCPENDEPSPDISKSLADLLLLPPLISRANLVVTHSFQSSDTLLFSKHMRMHRGIWHPNTDADTEHDCKSAEEKEDNLVRSDVLSIIKRNTVRDKASEDLSEAYVTWISKIGRASIICTTDQARDSACLVDINCIK